MKAVVTILCVLMLVRSGLAQSCSGSVGDPVVNFTFGSGVPTLGPPLPADVTNYRYSPFDCVNDDHYSILSRSSACHDSIWHTFSDHTGDGNGYFMLVNGSEAPRNFYVGRANGLCPGATFQFAVWVMNVCNYSFALPPRLLLTIELTDGTVLGSYATGDIAVNTTAAVWQQYGFNFTIPAGVSDVVLRVANAAPPGGVGNDLALDDITFRPVGPETVINTADFSGDSVLRCIKDARSITFHSGIANCYSSTAYQWQVSSNGGSWTDIAGADKPDYTCTPFPLAGTFRYRLTVAEADHIASPSCRVASNQFQVDVYGVNVRTISINNLSGDICEDAPLTFAAGTSYAGSQPSFQWMVNDKPVAGAVDSVSTLTNLSDGDRVACYFISSLTCNDPLTSDAIPVTVLSKARMKVDTAICEGKNYEGYTTVGNYIDTFPGSNGCDSLRTLNLWSVYPIEHSSFDTSICYGTAYSGLDRSGIYTYVYPSVHGCDSVHTIHLTVLPDINAQPYMDTLLCTGDVISLSPGAFDTYKWQDGATTNTRIISRGGTYTVDVSTRCGIATKTFSIEERLCVVSFPSAFSPNGDGRNDIFRIVNGYDINEFRFMVFDRWGNKVFETANPRLGWNGTIGGKSANNGAYIWFCSYRNRSKPENNVNLKGTVILIR